ncbi:MAG: SIS domain-containing protein [Geminicoccaceae bacterium]
MSARSQNAAVVDPGDGTLAVGRRVLRLEADALLAAAETLGQPFHDAVHVLGAVKGRVIVTGMGKSGHIARKIAATFASTGTPAHFVHPAEASHGDLGMITGDDVVLALSNSGETPELADVIGYAKRFSIPLIALVGRTPSALADAADVVLLLPKKPEACPMGLAPTTSTTASLALGDALAVALLELKGFTAADFGTFHPGGKLGTRLIKVDDLMARDDALPLVDAGTSLNAAILEITAKRLGCVGIVDGQGALIGIITDGDLRRHLSSDLLDQPVEALMTHKPKTIRTGALAAEAVALMNAHSITALFVMDAQRPVGALHMHDCLRAGVV